MSTLWAALIPLPFMTTAATGWLDARYARRVTVTVDAGFYDRTDCLVSIPLPAAGDALRVYEVKAGGERIAETPAALSADRAELRWVMAGRTAALSRRHFQVYLGSAASAPRLPIYPNPPPEPPAPNLLTNPGFEEPSPTGPSQAASWTVHPAEGLIAERASGQAHSGRFSLMLANRKGGETAASAEQTVAPLLPRRRYLISGWVKITECEGGTAVVTTWYSPRAGEKAPPNYKTQTGTQGVCDWLKIETTRIICFDADRKEHVYPPVTLDCTGGGRFEVACYYGVLTAYFDDLRLVEWSRDTLAPPTVTVGPPERRAARQ